MKMLQQYIERRFYRYLLPVARLYWFLLRPLRQGARCLIVAQGCVLLIQNTYQRQGVWDLPGGRMDKDESPEAAAIREVREEVGLVVTAATRLGEWYTERDYKRDTIHFYLAELPHMLPVTIDPMEIAVAAWYPLTELPGLLDAAAHKALELYAAAERSIPA